MNQITSEKGILVAGTHSDCGKTTITLGLMAALKARGLDIQPFKCGPDFIDPSLHKGVCGRTSSNLDLNMCEPDYVGRLYHNKADLADFSVVEGVMGLFDGGGASSASLAKVLDIPIILVVDARAMAESVAALVKGYAELDPDCRITGIILNRVGSPQHEEILRKSIAEHCGVQVVGVIPRNLDLTLPGRHLGLFMAEDGVLDHEKIALLAREIEAHCSLDSLLPDNSMVQKIKVSSRPKKDQSKPSDKKPVRIGVARDKAFCFYYEDNLDIIRKEGGEVVFFSPVKDTILPPELDGIYLGGGYPELYGEELSANTSMLSQIRKWSLDGRPLYGECGGFMYLTRGIHAEDKFYPLTAVFPVEARLGKKLARLGYRRVSTSEPTIFGPPGTILRGHEFHYSDIDLMPAEIERVYQLANGKMEGYQLRNTLAGYYHLHFGSTPQAVRNLLDFCKRNREGV